MSLHISPGARADSYLISDKSQQILISWQNESESLTLTTSGMSGILKAHGHMVTDIRYYLADGVDNDIHYIYCSE